VIGKQTSGVCRYTPYVYDSGRVSTCFFNTVCGQKYVGMPFGGRCKNCDRVAVKAAT
jgi:hypothetical protein